MMTRKIHLRAAIRATAQAVFPRAVCYIGAMRYTGATIPGLILGALLSIWAKTPVAGQVATAPDSSWTTEYRASATKINDMVHTRLEAAFDLDSCFLLGKVWLTLHPHFYPTDSLTLDAKQMAIAGVYLSQGASRRPLSYTYDGWQLHIRLDRTYQSREQYTVYLEYTAKPNQAKDPTHAKGLYFIRGDEKDPHGIMELWTDGETERTSGWCPVIDKPNQKTTEEISMTVPDRWVTLSNGLLIAQKKNANGTRTDHWKMDLPHAPYLFFMGAGDFSIVKDSFKGKEVNYYVEPEYASVARRIFGLTPSMIGFFERITGVPFPWPKYDQIALREFTSTAMENTTATAHADGAQQDARELVEGNRWESNIAHELFHQWCGDYVTCESWSNLTLNESFANYSQYLWKEHAYGEEEARAELSEGMADYLRNRGNEPKTLVRFYYADEEDLFDDVSYQKGGLILHMLRNYLGDSAFFKGLHLYLVTNKFKSAEAHQLRLAMEEASGQDLNWFFNQWYFGSGHPKVTIDYAYDAAAGKINVTIAQIQGAFRIPLTVDVYAGGDKKRYIIWVTREKETFSLDCPSTPDLVNVDAQKVILWDKKDNRPIQSFIFQYTHAANYGDRREAIEECARHQTDPNALDLLVKALKDPYYGLRLLVLQQLHMKSDTVRQDVEPVLQELAGTDPNSVVRAKAIELLGTYRNKDFQPIFVANLDDSSYSVAAASLVALTVLDSSAALGEAKKEMTIPTKRRLTFAVTDVLTEFGSENEFPFIVSKYELQPNVFPGRIISTTYFIRYLARVHQTERLKQAIDIIIRFRNSWPDYLNGRINPELTKLAAQKESEGLKDQADYINSQLTRH